MKKKGSKIKLSLLPSPELERSIEELADVITDSLKEGYQSELEPFEQYAKKIRAHIHENVHEFHTRFVHGYELLLEEIANEKEKD